MSYVAERTRKYDQKTVSSTSPSSFTTRPDSQIVTVDDCSLDNRSWEEGFTNRLRATAKKTSQSAEDLFLPERAALALDRIAYNPEFASKLATNIKDIQSARSKIDRYGSLAARLRGGLTRRSNITSLTGKIGGIKTEDLGDELVGCVERGDVSSVLSVDHELKELLGAVQENGADLEETMRMLSVLDKNQKSGEGDSNLEGAYQQSSLNSLVSHQTYSSNRDNSYFGKATPSSSALVPSQDTTGNDPLLERLEDWASGHSLDGLKRPQRMTMSSLKQDPDANKERIEHVHLATVLYRARNQVETLKSAGALIDVGRRASRNNSLETDLTKALEDDDVNSVMRVLSGADQVRNNKEDDYVSPEDLRAASVMLGRVANALESANASEEPLTSKTVARRR